MGTVTVFALIFRALLAHRTAVAPSSAFTDSNGNAQAELRSRTRVNQRLNLIMGKK